jgi:ABC-2 type transport system permease protein
MRISISPTGTTAQGAIVREKQLGTAAWALSKPVARSAFGLAKLVAYAVGFVRLATLAPSATFYAESLLSPHDQH